MKKTFIAPSMEVKKIEVNSYLITTSIAVGPATDAAGPVESHIR